MKPPYPFLVKCLCISLLISPIKASVPLLEETSLEGSVTRLLIKSPSSIQEKFKELFKDGGGELDLKWVHALNKEYYQAIREILISPFPLKELYMQAPYQGKATKKAFREMLQALKENKKLTTLEIKGHGVGNEEAKILSEGLTTHTTLTYLTLGRHHITNSGIASLAKSLEKNKMIQDLKFEPPFSNDEGIHNRWLKKIAHSIARNIKIADDLYQLRNNFHETLKKELILKGWFIAGNKKDLINLLPFTEAAYLKLEDSQKELLDHLDTRLLANVILAHKAFEEEYKKYDAGLCALFKKTRAYHFSPPEGKSILDFEMGIADILFNHGREDPWKMLDAFLKNRYIMLEEELTSFPCQALEKWIMRHNHKKNIIEAKVQQASSELRAELASFMKSYPDKIGSEHLAALSSKIEEAKIGLRRLEEEKLHYQDSSYTIKQDILNLKRTNFYRQLEKLFFKNFLTHEAIALGAFSRRAKGGSLMLWNLGAPFKDFYFPFHGEIQSGVLPGEKLYSKGTKLYKEPSLGERSRRLSLLHNHSVEKMRQISADLACALVYRYQGEIPYLSEESAWPTGLHQLASLLVGQVMDFAFIASLPFTVEDLAIYGTLHTPAWFQTKQMKFFKGRWCTSPSCSSESLDFHQLFSLFSLGELQDQNGGTYKPLEQISEKIKGFFEGNITRQGIRAEVRFMKKKGVEYYEETAGFKADTLEEIEEKEKFMTKARTYIHSISTSLEDLLE